MTKRLQVVSMGDDCQGVVLKGDRRNPEPIHFRVSFPGGDVEIVRATDGDDADYWVHVRVNNGHISDDPEAPKGRLTDARLDILDKHASESNLGDFNDPNLYHLALRVKPQR